MKIDVRYQNGFLYEHHGAWYVRYYQRTSKEDGSCRLNHASKHLGRSKDFRNISDVELCRTSFMQTVRSVETKQLYEGIGDTFISGGVTLLASFPYPGSPHEAARSAEAVGA
jgi:hypothetical protein